MPKEVLDLMEDAHLNYPPSKCPLTSKKQKLENAQAQLFSNLSNLKVWERLLRRLIYKRKNV